MACSSDFKFKPYDGDPYESYDSCDMAWETYRLTNETSIN